MVFHQSVGKAPGKWVQGFPAMAILYQRTITLSIPDWTLFYLRGKGGKEICGKIPEAPERRASTHLSVSLAKGKTFFRTLKKFT